MPELPEVETIRRDLEAVLTGKIFTDIWADKPKMIHNQTAQELRSNLLKQHITAVKRRGKLLMLELTKQHYLLIHLKMTGQLIYHDSTHLIAGGHSLTKQPHGFDLPNKFTHLIFTFNDGSKLFFNDMRQFGYVHLTDKEGMGRAVAKMGIEPLQPDFTLAAFTAAIQKHRTASVKAALLDQRYITGIGNIYADEICFAAHINPTRPVNKLTDLDIKRLHQVAQEIIAQAIKQRGTTFSDYVDAKGQKGNFVPYLQVYGRSNQPCKICQTVLKKTKVAGRGTVHCPTCQL